MNILITGLTGFIGTNLKKSLINKNYNLAAISRIYNDDNKIKYIEGDLLNLSRFKNQIIAFKPDIVIYLAWFNINCLDKKNSNKNLRIAKNFFNLIFKSTNCKKIIITGSCLEYKKKVGPCKETSELDYDNDFAHSKIDLYNYVQSISEKKNVKLYWLRLFYVIGAFQKKKSLIPTLINNLRSKKKIRLHNPYNSNDFVSVEKVCQTILCCITDNIPRGIYNVGGGKSTSVYNIIKILENKIPPLKNLSFYLPVKDLKSYKETVNFWSDNTKYNRYFKKIKIRSLNFYINKIIKIF